jgi:hypothetical protein
MRGKDTEMQEKRSFDLIDAFCAERLLFQVTTRIILTLGLKIGGYKKF